MVARGSYIRVDDCHSAIFLVLRGRPEVRLREMEKRNTPWMTADKKKLGGDEDEKNWW